jgi:uncharacterized membrane protein
MKEFVKTTVIGGVLFLLPVAVLLIVLGHAMRLADKVAVPISKSLHLDNFGDVAGASAATVIAVLVLIVLSFGAGLIARTEFGVGVSRRFETSILGGLPQYQMIKSMAEGLAQVESAKGVRPALVSIEDGWQIGYLLEALENGWVAVFLPQAPTPMSGNVMYFPTERVRPLNLTMIQAMSLVKQIGVGSAKALRGVDLRQPVSCLPS